MSKKENFMETKYLVVPFYVDSPLNITLNKDSGELTVDSYHVLSDGEQTLFRLHFSSQATQEMFQALTELKEQIDINALLPTKQHNVQ